MPACAGIPLTQRGVARSFAVVTAHTRDGALPELPQADTLVAMMAVKPLRAWGAAWRARGRHGRTPAGGIAAATTRRQGGSGGAVGDRLLLGRRPPAFSYLRPPSRRQAPAIPACGRQKRETATAPRHAPPRSKA